MNKQITLEGDDANWRYNPNIILLKNKQYPVKLHRGVHYLHCLGCFISKSHNLPFTTKKKFYLLNAHGGGFCEDCMRINESIEQIERIQQIKDLEVSK